jgi:hypothetical protein
MKCRKCNHTINEGNKFCPSCGILIRPENVVYDTKEQENRKQNNGGIEQHINNIKSTVENSNNTTITNSGNVNITKIDQSKHTTINKRGPFFLKISIAVVLITVIAVLGTIYFSSPKVPSGTYVNTIGDDYFSTKTSYTFKGNKVVMGSETMGITTFGAEFTYKLDDSQLKIYENPNSAALVMTYEKKGDSIFLNGVEYIKDR